MRTHPITGVYKLHSGTDISAPIGAKFVAMADGTVIKAGYNSAYGNIVKQGQAVLKVGSTRLFYRSTCTF